MAGSVTPESPDRVLTFGETMGLLHPDQIAPLSTARSFSLSIGGAESNVAIGLARLGVPVTWAGRVGADGLGQRIVRELRAEGVTVAAVTDPDRPTGLMLKERRAAGRTSVMYYRKGSAGGALAPGDLAPALITAHRVLHVTGITPALSVSAMAAVRHAVGLARGCGALVSFDVNHRPKLWDAATAAPVYRELARAADLVFAGAGEAAILVGQQADPATLARALGELGPAQVIVKLGADGCEALIDGQQLTMPAIQVPVIDSVGAGDAFTAAYLAEWLAGEPAVVRLRTAVAAGAAACTTPGDWESAPSRADLVAAGEDPIDR
jgi:2-dehydro-3-deoxygluconokinase